jgi:hypothetical protein
MTEPSTRSTARGDSVITRGIIFFSSEAFALSAVLLLVVGYLLVGYFTLSPGHDWGDDWAQYLNHARNLATGRPYADTGYIFNPNEPHVGPPSYSPGLPLLLTPIVKVWGLDVIALKSVSLVCMAAAILMTFMLFRGPLGAGAAAGASLLFGLHEFSWSLRDSIVSEPPYILWTLIALYLASRAVHNRGIATSVLCGLFAYAAFATRPIGIALIIAVVAYEVAQRGLHSWRICFAAGIPAVGMVLQRHFIAFADYSAEVRVLALPEMVGNVVGYWKATASLFPLGGKLSLLSPLAIAAVALLGISYRLRSFDTQAQPAAANTVTHRVPSRPAILLERLPVDLWYLGLYLGALVVLPFETTARYLVPILPILCAYVLYAIRRGLQWTRYARPAMLAFISACLCYYAALYWAHRGKSAGDDALCNDCRAMYLFIRTHTEPEARIAFAKPRAMALLADRQAWVWASNRDQRFNWAELQSTHINYIVLVSPKHPLASRYPALLTWDAWRSNPKLTLVFENQSFRVLRFIY